VNAWRAVVFDLDDTLYPERDFVLGGFLAAARWAETHLGIPADDGYTELRRLYESGVRGDTFNRWLEALGIEAAPIVPRLVDAYRRHEPRLEPFPDAVGVLYRLRPRLRVGLLSDGYLDVQRRKLDALNVAHLFDAVVFSDEWGREAWKPSTRPFLAILEQLQVAAASTVYVADNPLKDFLGARQLGISTVQVVRAGGEYASVAAPTPTHAADHVVRDLAECERVIAPSPRANGLREEHA
jgi:putative hydrolase of the HAD superfamily